MNWLIRWLTRSSMVGHPRSSLMAKMQLLPGIFVTVVLMTSLTAGQTQQGPGGRALTLEQAIQLAEERAEQIEIARTGITRAEADYLRTRSQRLPQLNASTGY